MEKYSTLIIVIFGLAILTLPVSVLCGSLPYSQNVLFSAFRDSHHQHLATKVNAFDHQHNQIWTEWHEEGGTTFTWAVAAACDCAGVIWRICAAESGLPPLA
jgi:hypothetical protein